MLLRFAYMPWDTHRLLETEVGATVVTAYRLVVWDQGPDLMHNFCVERQRAAVYAAAWDRATVDDTDRTMYKADVYRALRSWFQEHAQRPLINGGLSLGHEDMCWTLSERLLD
jgi:hypothetical protein